MKTKALVLFSGGLDSRLAIKILQEQQLEVEALYIKLPFGKGCSSNIDEIIKFTEKERVNLHQIDASKGKLFQKYLKIIRKPEFQRGKGYNPCKDCKIFIFQQAKELAKKINAEVIATGEVLGQRPLSQMKKDFILSEKKAKLKNKILRPLSSKLLSETVYEKKGLINRENLLNFKGRERKNQINLAKKYKINYPNPAGGCILCEKLLKNRFKKLLKKKLTEEQAELISLGRHFLIKDTWIILGRNENENKILENKNKGKIIESKIPGPTALYFGKIKKDLIEQLIQAYSKEGLEKDKQFFEKYKI